MDYILIPTVVDDKLVQAASGRPEVIQICDRFNVYEQTEDRLVIIATAVFGYICGVVFPAPTLSRRPGSQNFQTSLCVECERTIPRGASGSAVFDAETGLLAGYVVLGCPMEVIWYMTPILNVLDDLQASPGVQASCQIQLNVSAIPAMSPVAGSEHGQRSSLGGPTRNNLLEPGTRSLESSS
jgi:hypothetical protein